MCSDTSPRKKGEEPCLPHGLSVVNTYTKITAGGRHVTVVIKNQTTAPIIIGKGVKVTYVVAANRAPPVEVMPGILISQMKCREFGEPGCLLSIERRHSSAARFIGTGEVVRCKSHICSCSVNQVP